MKNKTKNTPTPSPRPIHLIPLILIPLLLPACTPASAQPIPQETQETQEIQEPITSSPSTQPANEITLPNPMEEMSDIMELQSALSFTMLDLPAYYAEEDPHYYIIDGTLGEIQCKVAGRDVVIRQQEGSGDITGWYDVTYKELKYDGKPCHYGKSDDTFIAWWEDADYSYAVTVTGINENDFINEYIYELSQMSQRNYLEQIGFERTYPGTTPREDTKQLEEELGIAILELPEGYDHFEPVYFGITDDTESGFISYKCGLVYTSIDLITGRQRETEFDDEEFQTVEHNGINVEIAQMTGPSEGVIVSEWSDGACCYTMITSHLELDEVNAILELLTASGGE